MIPPFRDVSSLNRENPDQVNREETLSKLKISIGPVELHARLLDTPAAEAIRNALPFSSEARVSDSIVSFSAPGAAPMRKCRPGGNRAGEFILSHENSACGIDISKLPFVRSREHVPGRSGNVWARAMGDIGALKHVIDGDPVAVEAID
jgi:hypothetical protein